ncbi:Immunoglobulin-like domain [Trinorchestia longiramus]|nr:Immunoglobulin-like domain [Trinorchestia longiramus]
MGEVVSRPAKVSMTHQRRENSPPVIIEEPQSLNATLGQRVELPCNATGFPVPDVVWSKEGGFLQLGETTLVKEAVPPKLTSTSWGPSMMWGIPWVGHVSS